MPVNNEEFNREIKLWAYEVVPQELLRLVKRVALELFGKIVRKTPVDTGRARGGWTISIGALSGVEVEQSIGEGRKLTKTLAELTAEARRAVASLEPYETVFIENNVRYIFRLENGYSEQAPKGMVALSVEEVLNAA